jgi:hypothetical protein
MIHKLRAAGYGLRGRRGDAPDTIKQTKSLKVLIVKKIFWLALWLCVGPMSVQADIIYFKDGMKTVCLEKAWEENGEVKCEYAGVILTYRKSEVLRIEKRRAPKSKPISGADQKADSKAAKKAFGKIRATSKSDGLVFYDPRRSRKYWISATAKYNTFQEAVSALAKQYDRTPQWIQDHMGETNDLQQIHRNLATGKSNSSPNIVKAETVLLKKIEFYNPRRAKKYWTSPTTKHNTYSDAIAALAKQYGRSSQWVQKYMGQTNDLLRIHENLKTRKSNEASE